MKKKFVLIVCLLMSGISSSAQILIDGGFNASQISNPPDFSTVRVIVVQPDGKILFGGTTDYDAVPTNSGPSFGRLLPDGSWDVPFQNNVGYTANTGFWGVAGSVIERVAALNGGVSVQDIALLPGGKIMVVGDFLKYNSNNALSIARLNADGTMDGFGNRGGFSNFEGVKTPGYGINAIVVQTDGKMIVGGDFESSGDQGIPFGYIARVNSDGSIDPTYYSFDNATNKGFNARVSGLALQADGKVIAGGNFTTFRNLPCGPLARINADYTLDVGFYLGQGTGFGNAQIRKVVVQSDGKIIVAGNFTSFNGVPRPGILRLNRDGSLDTSFDPGTGPAGVIYALTLQFDGKLFVGGNFTGFNGTTRSGMVRLNANGSVDDSFNPLVGFGPRPVDATMGVHAITVQSDKKILAGGDIGSYDGTSRYSLVRLVNDAVTLPVALVSFDVEKEGNSAGLKWLTSFETQSESFEIQRSRNGKFWETLGKVAASGESRETKVYAFVDKNPDAGINLYRLKMIDADKSFSYSRILPVSFDFGTAMVIYPNPTSDILYFHTEKPESIQSIALYTDLGLKISEISNFSATGYEVKKLAAGKYILKLRRKNGDSESHAFLIQH